MSDSLRSLYSQPLLPQLLTGAMIVVLCLLGEFSITTAYTGWLPRQAAWAQTTDSNGLVRRYAKAVLEIEPLRLRYFKQAQQLMPGKIPPNVCYGNYQTNIPQQLESVCDRYLRESKTIIQKHHLTLEQFNAITVRARNDSAYSELIQQELLRQQQP